MGSLGSLGAGGRVDGTPRGPDQMSPLIDFTLLYIHCHGCADVIFVREPPHSLYGNGGRARTNCYELIKQSASFGPMLSHDRQSCNF